MPASARCRLAGDAIASADRRLAVAPLAAEAGVDLQVDRGAPARAAAARDSVSTSSGVVDDRLQARRRRPSAPPALRAPRGRGSAPRSRPRAARAPRRRSRPPAARRRPRAGCATPRRRRGRRRSPSRRRSRSSATGECPGARRGCAGARRGRPRPTRDAGCAWAPGSIIAPPAQLLDRRRQQRRRCRGPSPRPSHPILGQSPAAPWTATPQPAASNGGSPPPGTRR